MSRVMGPPDDFCLDLSLRVRSGLTGVQLCPPFVDLKIISAAQYSVLGSWGEISSGAVQLKRGFSFSAPFPETSSGQTEISISCSVRLSKRETKLSAPAKTMLGSGG